MRVANSTFRGDSDSGPKTSLTLAKKSGNRDWFTIATVIMTRSPSEADFTASCETTARRIDDTRMARTSSGAAISATPNAAAAPLPSASPMHAPRAPRTRSVRPRDQRVSTAIDCGMREDRDGRRGEYFVDDRRALGLHRV